MYGKILVAVDGSSASLRGLGEALRLAMGSDAEMVLRFAPVPVLMVRDKPESP